MKLAKKFVVAFLLVLPFFCEAQNSNVLLNREYLSRFEQLINQEEAFHTSIKPYNFNDFKNVPALDSIYLALMYSGNNSFLKAFRNKGLLEYKSGDLQFLFTPLINVNASHDQISERNYLENSIGARAVLDFTDKISGNVNLLFGKASFVDYIDSLTRQSEVVSGQGYAYVQNDHFKFRNSSGYVSYSPSSFFNFQAGSDKNFIGDGYRSLLLSDHARNYPFFKITTSFWKFKYLNLFTNLKDISNSSGLRSNYTNKYSTIHYLSFNLNSKISIGLFETVVFEKRDSTSKFEFDVNYLNPIIFFRPVEYSMGSADNSLMGLNYKFTLGRNFKFYGQAVIDEFLLNELKADAKQLLTPNDTTLVHGWWANKYGAQLGFRWFKAFGIKNLETQYEYNFVRPFTYSHGSSIQNYGHFNQPLSHPLGANFKELLGFVRYVKNNWFFEINFSYAIYGADFPANLNPSNYGGNIFQSYNNRQNDYGNEIGQGLKSEIINGGLKVSYLINPIYNLQALAGIAYRTLTNDISYQKADYYFIGIRTSLWNTYYDR